MTEVAIEIDVRRMAASIASQIHDVNKGEWLKAMENLQAELALERREKAFWRSEYQASQDEVAAVKRKAKRVVVRVLFAWTVLALVGLGLVLALWRG